MEAVIKKAIELLDKKFNLPKKGFVAGGALGNTINKLKWGGKCVINDIDIFLVDEIKPLDKKLNIDKKIPKSFTTEFLNKTDQYALDNYSNRLHICKLSRGDDYITVKTSEREDIFNFVKFDTNKLDYDLFLKSFDINCTQVGYDLEKGIAYWTEEFEEYVNTKELKVTLPNTPSHTAIRILKKRDELEAILNVEEEFKFLQWVHVEKIHGVKKQWFAEKYHQIYEEYKEEISQYFTLQDSSIIRSDNPNFLLQENIKIWRLYPKDASKLEQANFVIKNFISVDEYIYYWRKVKDNHIKKDIWKKLQVFYNNDAYLENYNINGHEKDTNKISLLIEKYPALIVWLKKLNINEQLHYISDLEDVCNENPILYDVLYFHKHIVPYDSIDDFKQKMAILKIRYRKKIYQENKVKVTSSIEDMFSKI